MYIDLMQIFIIIIVIMLLYLFYYRKVYGEIVEYRQKASILLMKIGVNSWKAYMCSGGNE